MASRESLWLTDTIWMGVNKVRAGGATTFVGTPEMVANQFRQYIDAGVTHFIMHGWPYLEEAEIFGREVLPLLEGCRSCDSSRSPRGRITYFGVSYENT